MSQGAGSGATATAGGELSPRGRCRACGYPVHPGAGFICTECGADLRQTGIVVGDVKRFARVKPILRFLLFAVTWAIICGYASTLAVGLIFEHVWPWRVDFRSTYRLWPVDKQYDVIVMAEEMQGVLHGSLAADVPLKELAG